MVTRNIRKLGDVADLSLCTFTQNHNGLIGKCFEIPASAYCHRSRQFRKFHTADLEICIVSIISDIN